MVAEETRKREAAHHNLVAFREDMDRIEAKWRAKLEDANDEITRLQLQVKENKETLGTTIEKSVTMGLEVKERRKEITTLHKVVATL